MGPDRCISESKRRNEQDTMRKNNSPPMKTNSLGKIGVGNGVGSLILDMQRYERAKDCKTLRGYILNTEGLNFLETLN